MTEELDKAVEEITNSFLRWPLPDSVCADGCATKQGPGRVGTNLLTYTETKQMINDLVRPILEKQKAQQTRINTLESALADIRHRAYTAKIFLPDIQAVNFSPIAAIADYALNHH